MPAIVALRPDLVVVNDEENRLEDVDALRSAGVRGPRDRGALRGRCRPLPPRPRHRGRHDALDQRARGLPPNRYRFDARRATVRHRRRQAAFVPIWRRPWMTINADTYGSSVLDLLGLVNVYADAADRYPTVTLDEVAERHPELVLLPSEPYPFKERHLAELAPLAGADIRFVDGQDLFWWGTRTPARDRAPPSVDRRVADEPSPRRRGRAAGPRPRRRARSGRRRGGTSCPRHAGRRGVVRWLPPDLAGEARLVDVPHDELVREPA